MNLEAADFSPRTCLGDKPGAANNGTSASHRTEAGVLVNGEGATWAVLEDGDSIEIGGARFRFEAGAAIASEEA